MSRKVVLPEEELEFEFVRSSGPGGQNVNKTATKVRVSFSVEKSAYFSEDEKARILKSAVVQAALARDGRVACVSQSFRSQGRNKEDAVDKLTSLLARALTRPKARRKSKVPKSANAKRLRSKKRHGDTKRLRGKGGLGD